jgi:hypothetical protein
MEIGKPHWTQRPGSMLAAVLGTNFAIYLANLGINLPVSLMNTGDMPDRAYLMSVLLNGLSVCATLAIGVLFFWLVRRAQRKHGAAGEISFKTDAAFRVGIPLTLLYIVLYDPRYFINNPATAVTLVLGTLVFALNLALFFGLLFPLMERRFGAMKAALIISAAFALLSVLDLLFGRVINVLLFVHSVEGYSESIFLDGLAGGIFSSLITTGALYLLRSALYLTASRRMPGSWLLFASVPGLVSLLYRSIENTIPRGSELTVPLTTLCIQFPYYLLVFALSLGVIAAFRKWKTFAEFSTDFNELIRKARGRQNDIED